MFVISGTFRFVLVLGAGLAVSMWSSAGRAYTYEEQQACSGDAFRLCSSEIPDIDRVTACMVRRQAELSPGCQVYFRKPESDGAAGDRPRRPTGLRPASTHKSTMHRTKRPMRADADE